MPAITRPTLSRAGPDCGCRPSSNGRWLQATVPVEGRTLGAGHLRPMRGRELARGPQADVSAMSGNGRRSAYLPYPGFKASRRAPSANTTASSCAISSCCAAAPAPRLKGTCAPPTAISSIRISAGSSWACGSPRRHDGRRHPASDRRSSSGPRADLPRLDPDASDFAKRRACGLARKPRSLPCRFFYDARGSALFEEITPLDGILSDAGRDRAARSLWRRDRRRAWATHACWSSSARARAARRACCLAALGQCPPTFRSTSPRSLAEAAEWLRAASRPCHRPLIADFTKARTLPGRAAPAQARLLLRLDHRQSHARRREAFLANARAAARAPCGAFSSASI